MGIKGLWEHLPKTDHEQSLMDFAIKYGFEANPNGLRACRLGIDVSLWFYHARKATGQTRNGESQMFFHRCCRLLRAPVLPLFVFDGPQRPPMKRNKPTKIIETAQLNDIRELIIAFGFDCLTAPSEAEAALSQLNAAGIIDAVLSDDTDCFLFGATTVLRSVKSDFTSTYMETLDVYTIQTLEESSFSHEELLFIALLRGGDYDLGLTGCGITTAVNLKQVGFGKRLVQAWRNRHNSLSEWIEFLSVWRSNVKNELMSNVSGNSGQVNRTAANSITFKFPRYEVLAAYLDPERFDDYELQYISERLWKTRLNLSKLVVACLNQFQWSTRSKILTTFQSLVWPGAIMRLLLDVTMKMDAGIQTELPFTIIPVGRKPKTQINCVSIQLCIASFIQAMEDGLSRAQPLYKDTITFHWKVTADDMINDPDGDDSLQCFWIPRSIITAMCSQHKYLNNTSQQNVHL